MKKLLTILGIIFAVLIYGSVNAQIYGKDGTNPNSAEWSDMADPNLNWEVDLDLNWMADPNFNPLEDLYIRDDRCLVCDQIHF